MRAADDGALAPQQDEKQEGHDVKEDQFRQDIDHPDSCRHAAALIWRVWCFLAWLLKFDAFNARATQRT